MNDEESNDTISLNWCPLEVQLDIIINMLTGA
jgi:hypothetical protein